MEEVAGAVIATSLVLVAVFVPVAFFPGTTGILFRPFALTIAFSISISAFNALTLTRRCRPCSWIASHGQKIGSFGRSIASLARSMTVPASLRGFLRFRLVAAILFFAGLGLTYVVFQRVPKGFVPNEDQGYFMLQSKLRPGRLGIYQVGRGAS